ncbi:hypothetical protein ES703_27880 [subsurface metagenome]
MLRGQESKKVTMINSNEGKISNKIIFSQNYKNEYLFSEIYLRDITKLSVTDENLRASLQTIKEWREYADKTSIKKWITSYIKPVLDILGFGHQENSKKQANILVLFPDVGKTQSMSLCYVVPPGEDMDCTLKGKHYAEKIIRSLREHSFQWGILTDGFYWRIYHTKELNPYETYVEVDLEAILNDQEYSAFQIFYFFFSPSNFITSEIGECKFDTYKEESTKTTEYIEENLRAAIERDEEGGKGVLQTLCLGYINALNQNTYSDEERIRIYCGATLYLFRLLFLFYSTARNLLEVESIRAFKSIVKDSFQFHNEGGAQSNSYDLWLRLQNIFAEIDLTYDGGLFNPYESNLTQFIEESRINDSFLSEVIFGLGYYQKSRRNFVPIEYRDLSVQHIGSLYERLLEYKLFIAEENKVVRKSGNKIRFIPETKAGRIKRSETIIKKGEVYFSKDARERKLTGSYYTPEDVVEYIVKNTVDTLLAEKKEELMSEIKPILNDLELAPNESEQKRLKLFIDEKIIKFIDEKILSLSVLDSTMGSGHFLVNATNHIANFIVELLNEYPGCNPKIDSNTAFWRRRVVEDCIYGVDINPLAVELAKLCLWITTAFKKKPLSFLNHHLKQGNSLVGVSISDIEKFLEKSEGKHSLFMQAYINCIREVAEDYKEKLSKLTETREDIEEKKEMLAKLDKDLYSYKYLCNLFTHYLLGELKENDLLSQIENLKRVNKTEKVLTSLNSKNFFHWELAFPDVFNGNNPGFDLVIGNPPYVEYYKVKYKIFNYKTKSCNNLYAFFVEKSYGLLKKSGYFGMILQQPAICTDRMIPLQKLFLEKEIIFVSNFADRPSKLFKSLESSRAVIVISNNYKGNKHLYTTDYIKFKAKDRKDVFNKIKYFDSKDLAINGALPKVGSSIKYSILKKIYSKKKYLRDYCSNIPTNYKIYYYNAPRYFIPCQLMKPSKKLKKLYVIREDHLIPIFSILNSSLFYLWMDTYFAGRTGFCLREKDILGFPINLPFNKSNGYNLKIVALKLNEIYERYEKNRGDLIYKFKGFLKKSKYVIDKIDNILGNHYDFNKEEIKYIKNYDIDFRINQS